MSIIVNRNMVGKTLGFLMNGKQGKSGNGRCQGMLKNAESGQTLSRRVVKDK